VGRVRSSLPRRLPRHRLPLHRRVRADPAAARSWLATGALALAAALAVGGATSRAEHARDRWGTRRTVLVAARPVRAGAALRAGDLRTERWPVAVAPPGALASVPPGGWAAADLDPGTPLTPSLIRRPGAGRARRRTVAVPAGEAALPVREGDRVDVWAPVAEATGPEGLRVRRIATGAVVAGTGPRTVVVAVEPGEVAAVARAAATGGVALVGSG
jgi:Flp pilus assembly protein CpaB